MGLIRCKGDFSDVDGFLQGITDSVIAGEKEEGVAFVEDAKSTGNYQNRTGNLRASNTYEADKSGLTLRNTAEYASYVEAKGFEVAGSAALRTLERLKRRFER